MVQEHDPYEEMLEGAKEDIRPSLPGDQSRKKEKAAEKKAEAESAKSELQAAESNASGGLYKNGASAEEENEGGNGFRFTGSGASGGKKKGLLGGKFKIGRTAVIGIGFIIAIFAVGAVMLSTPIFTIGHLDFNLMDALGFTKTSGILQKLATRIIQKKLSKGEVPSALAGDLAEHGINVGQVTASGDFVRTDVYIADVDKLKDVATLGHYEVTPSEGELAVLYDGKVIMADDFVATVESNMKMFADYTEALDISAKYYYSDEVSEIYNEMGLSRSIFADWVDSGDEEKNAENFNTMMEDSLNNNSTLVLSPLLDASSDDSTSRVRSRSRLISPAPVESPDDLYVDPGAGSPPNSQIVRPSTTDVTGDSDSGDVADDSGSNTADDSVNEVELDISDKEDAAEVISSLSSEVTDYDQNIATSKAAHLLNAAISAGEPYLAASAFVGIESPIQQARIEGTGPINELMNMLNAESSITYIDVNTGKTETKKQSILTTGNFVAAVSAGKFSTNEAANFARDRGLIATKMGNDEIIKDTTVSTDGQKESNILMSIIGGSQANQDELAVLNDSIEMAMIKKNSELITSQVGGNRIVEGGSFLSNMINAHVIAAMSSDEATITSYNREARTEMARMAAAERATKSPFDVSSPYTFMGSVAHGFANAMIRSGGSGGMIANSISTVANLTDDSAKGLLGSVMADGEDDTDYGTTYGDYCDTVQSIGTEGDIYCTAHGVISTGYMDYDDEDWNNALGDNLDDSGNINETGQLSDFIASGMDRWATVGVESVEVCDNWRRKHSDPLSDLLSKLLKRYNTCKGIEEGVGTGAKFAFIGEHAEQAKLFAGYVLYDEVSSLLDDSVSKVTAYREKYYKEHPLDNSRAGKIARISGMTKQEAEVALAYADYLTFVARYNPAERYAFGVELMPTGSREPLVEHASQVAVELYVMWHGRTEYDDLRTRIRVA